MRPLLLKSRITFARLSLLLVLCLALLQSCNMGNYYFRLHPSAKKKHLQTDTQSATTQPELFHSSEKNDIPTTNDNPGYPSTNSAETPSDSTQSTNTYSRDDKKVTDQTTNQLEKVTPHTYSKKQHHIWHSQEAKSSFPTEVEVATFFLLLALMIIIFTGICVFLISWIFAPALLALKIALWTMAGLAVLPVILFIIVLFSQL